MTNSEKKQPAHKTSFGNIEVTIWENSNSDGKLFHTFNLKRSYTDKNGDWQEQNVSLAGNDVLKAAAALTKAKMDFYSEVRFKEAQKPAQEPTGQSR